MKLDRFALKDNILANYVGAGVVVLAPILALPWYLAALGPELWGLVGFVATLQAVLALLDSGASQALVREFTLRVDDDRHAGKRAATLLCGFERLYWLFALCAGAAATLCADLLATSWLKLGNLALEQGRLAVYGAAALFVAQFPGSVYRSVLVGAQAQIKLNTIVTAGALLRHVGGVAVVLTWPTLAAYLAWHAAAVLCETAARAVAAWDALGVARDRVTWDSAAVRQVLAHVAAMTGATLVGALAVQLDRIILSKMVPIDEFGYYTIASSVAGGVLQLIYPITQAIFPRAVALRGSPAELRRLYAGYAGVVSILIAVGAIVFLLIGRELIEIWLRHPDASARVHTLLKVLLVGSALNALYGVGYLHWIVQGNARRVLQVNCASLIIGLIAIPLMVEQLGSIGAAIGWLALNAIGLLVSAPQLLASKR